MKLQVVQLSLSGFCWRETIRDYHGPEVGTRGLWSCQMGVVGPLSWNSMHWLVITKSGADKQTFAGLTSSYPLKAGPPNTKNTFTCQSMMGFQVPLPSCSCTSTDPKIPQILRASALRV